MAAPDAEGADDPVDRAWAEVLAAWGDDAAHKKLVALCAALGRLPEAGKRYREIRDSDPSRRAEAQKRIEQLLAAAMARLEVERAPRDDRSKRRLLFVVALALMLAMIGAAAWAVVR